jgi:hypothetical protein
VVFIADSAHSAFFLRELGALFPFFSIEKLVIEGIFVFV